MTAAWMWARAELRARWKAWILLGILAGVTVGVAAAGLAGARRTERAVPAYVAAAHVPTAALLVNDPAFGPAQRARVAALPGVQRTFPFLVGVASQVFSPAGLGDASAALFPATAASIRVLAGPLVEGRLPDPTRADEVVVDENSRDRFHLDLGSTMVVGQSAATEGQVPAQFAAPDGVQPFRQRMRVVGIGKSVSSDPSWTPSSGFYAKYGAHMPELVNIFADLRGGSAAIPRFGDAVAQVLGHPVNVEDSNDLFGIRKATNVTGFEQDGLLLFALAALLGGGVLVGQALVRAVSASAADLATWRAIGSGSRARRPGPRPPCIAHRHGRAAHHGRRGSGRVSPVPARHGSRLRPAPRSPGRRARHGPRRVGCSRRRALDRDARRLVARDPPRAAGGRAVGRRTPGRADERCSGADDRRPAGRGAGARPPGRAGPIRPHRRHRRCVGRGRVSHVPRRDPRRHRPAATIGRRVGLRHRSRWRRDPEPHRPRRRARPRRPRRAPGLVAPRGAGRRTPGPRLRDPLRRR